MSDRKPVGQVGLSGISNSVIHKYDLSAIVGFFEYELLPRAPARERVRILGWYLFVEAKIVAGFFHVIRNDFQPSGIHDVIVPALKLVHINIHGRRKNKEKMRVPAVGERGLLETFNPIQRGSLVTFEDFSLSCRTFVGRLTRRGRDEPVVGLLVVALWPGTHPCAAVTLRHSLSSPPADAVPPKGGLNASGEGCNIL